MHEAQFHKRNAFLTLTYKKEELPEDYSVSKRVHQLFVKRLRESVGAPMRYFVCGEYGSEEGALPLQPHYHYLIFGWRPTDLELHSARDGIPLYTSKALAKLWSHGFHTVGNVTYKTAAYCARYVVKKIGGDPAAAHYSRIHPVTGARVQVEPEFALQSRKPGLGDEWYSTFKSDVYPSDFCVVEEKKHPVPKYYVKKLEEEERTKVARARARERNKHRADMTPARLAAREKVQLDRAAQLKRTLK